MNERDQTEFALMERLAALEEEQARARRKEGRNRRRLRVALTFSPVVLGALWGSAALSQTLTTFQPGQPASAAAVNENFEQLRANVVPAGSILAFGGEAIPPNYLLCNGQALSRANFPELFAAIGTSWGAGNGSTTFNLPDLRGRFQRGAHAVALDPTLNRSVGSAQGEEVGSHGHSASGNVNNGNHNHSIPSFGVLTLYTYAAIANGSYVVAQLQGQTATGNASAPSPVSVSIGNTGGETRPDNAAVNFIIRTGR